MSFLGKGWGFPPTFNKTTRDVAMLRDEDDIQSSLHLLLSTRLGERVLRHDYGCNLDELLFKPLTTTLSTYVSDLIETAILYHEPRIDLNRIEIRTADLDGLMEIYVDYKVRATNSRFNYVYPFYINEGTNI